MERIFIADDLVIPIIQEREQFPNPCRVMVIVDDDQIKLTVGPRDWQWNRETGELIGSGCGCMEAPDGDKRG
jgi:hypothetical protein